MEEILHQLRVVDYPIIDKVFLHPRWCRISFISSISTHIRPSLPHVVSGRRDSRPDGPVPANSRGGRGMAGFTQDVMMEDGSA